MISASLNLRLAIYDVLEASSHLTVPELIQIVDIGTPVTQAQVRAILSAEPEVFWPEEERWDLAIFHRFRDLPHLFCRRGGKSFDQDRFLRTVLADAIRLKGEPIDLVTMAEKYVLKVRKSLGGKGIKHFPTDRQGIVQRLLDFVSHSQEFHLLSRDNKRYFWKATTWPERAEITTSAYLLAHDFLDRAFDYLEKRRHEPTRLVTILHEVLGIDANHSDFSAAFAQANSALTADNDNFVQVQEQAWLLVRNLPPAIEDIPAPIAIPRWRNPQEEKLVDALYAQWPLEALSEAQEFVTEEESIAPDTGFDENFLNEMRFVLPYRWRQAGVLKVNARERRLFPDRPARVYLQFHDQNDQTFPVWLNNDTQYLYGLESWYASYLVPAGGVFYIERASGSKYDFKVYIRESQGRTFDGRQFFCEIDSDTYIEEARLRDLEALREKVEAAQATIKDVVCDVFENSGPEAELNYKQVWAQVHVIRPTTRRTVASILSAHPCFYQIEPGSGRWRYTPGLRDAPSRAYAAKRPTKASAKPRTTAQSIRRPTRYWLVPVRATTWDNLARPADASDDVFLVPWRGRSRLIPGDQLAFFDGKNNVVLAAANVLRTPMLNEATGQREVAVTPLLPAFSSFPYADLAGSLSVPRPEVDDFPVAITLEDMEGVLQHLRPLVTAKPAEPSIEELVNQALPKTEPAPTPGEIIPHTFGPNPTIPAFIARYGRPYDPSEPYERNAFATAIKAGKNTAIYNAHSYHTKVPPQGIEPYIEHYTNPGDIVLDPFCGSGMTGVAALKMGRRAILNDLSPAATHITFNYCTPVDVAALQREFERIKAAVKEEFDWLYGTTCDRCGGPATIQYMIWSDVYKCGAEGCIAELVLWDLAIDPQSGEVRDRFVCPECKTTWRKTQLRWLRSIPVVTNYECSDCRPKRSQHPATHAERSRIAAIEAAPIPYWFPTTRIDRDLDLWYERDYRKIGIYTVSDFYTKRNLRAWSRLMRDIANIPENTVSDKHLFAATASLLVTSKMHRYRVSGTGITSGTLYVPALSKEANVLAVFERKLNDIYSAIQEMPTNCNGQVVVSTTSATALPEIMEGTIDYIFTDPPYGSNIIYSDLSIIWEAWLGRFTDASREAVIHRRKKGEPSTLETYIRLMRASFVEMFRVLKPGRWASVVFHNTDDRVWKAIQQAVLDVGFELVNAQAFDKEQGSFKQVTADGAANFDIVLNLHKPLLGPASVETRSADDVSTLLLEIVESFLQSGPPPDHRTTQYLHSLVLRQFLRDNLIIEVITIPYLERLLPSRFRKINDRWYLQREAVVSTGQGFLVRNDASAVAWLEHVLAISPQGESDLIPQWQIATLGSGSRVRSSLEDLLRHNFWRDDATGLWCVPTAAQREILKRRRSKPVQLTLGLEETSPGPQMALKLD